MKDATHHLGQVQKKVIRSARQNNDNYTSSNGTGPVVVEENPFTGERTIRHDAKSIPKIIVRSSVA